VEDIGHNKFKDSHLWRWGWNTISDGYFTPADFQGTALPIKKDDISEFRSQFHFKISCQDIADYYNDAFPKSSCVKFHCDVKNPAISIDNSGVMNVYLENNISWWD